MARTYEFVVVHTAGSYDWTRKRVVHQRIEVVTHFHTTPKSKGGAFDVPLKGNAYNRYIYVDGRVHIGRLDHVGGAHCKGLNHRSLGVCVSGHGDFEPFNPAQLRSLVAQCATWCRLYTIPVEHVIGHRESPAFGAAPTGKSCPGKLNDMDQIRALVRDELSGKNQGLTGDGDPPSTQRAGRKPVA
jgi:N-acetyl-anhydromuramyl-L-alanine amidase AmpD